MSQQSDKARASVTSLTPEPELKEDETEEELLSNEHPSRRT